MRRSSTRVGCATFIDDREMGVLARSGEPADLADALQRLLASRELRERLGRAGRERFQSEFTDAAMRARCFRELERSLVMPAARR